MQIIEINKYIGVSLFLLLFLYKEINIKQESKYERGSLLQNYTPANLELEKQKVRIRRKSKELLLIK